ncbi:hypothetical protein [Actinoplanes sp. NPDC026670]|uniref:hypothetical protein n=1 Tax=Actinoplanes sp. NPDC026670 TaxID=3154700 RepID=UPI0033D736EA
MRTPRTALLALTVLLALAACSGVESETGLSPADERRLVDLGRLQDGEHVFFYTSRGEDLEDAGTFFTDSRLVSYWALDGNGKEDVSIPLKDITALDIDTNDDSWTYAAYVTVTWGKDGRKTKVYLQSSGDEFPQHFYDALKRQWERQR